MSSGTYLGALECRICPLGSGRGASVAPRRESHDGEVRLSVPAISEAVGEQGGARLESETLYAVIKTVSSSLDLDRVLGGIVGIATEATGCHACFIYFLAGERLVLR